jgi:hypothetical protein
VPIPSIRNLLLILLVFSGSACSGAREATVSEQETGVQSQSDADPVTADQAGTTPGFFSDADHHLMFRADPVKDARFIEDYRQYREEHPYIAYRFYQEEMLGPGTAFDKMVYTIQDLRAVGRQVELIDRPEPVYPKKKPLYGRILIVEISIIAGPDGTVEYVELANIRRNEDEPETTISTAISGTTPKWVRAGVHELDHPYILNSLKNASGYRFEPVVIDGQPVRFNVIVSYLYNADRM